jgi:hypothetical protein
MTFLACLVTVLRHSLRKTLTLTALLGCALITPMALAQVPYTIPYLPKYQVLTVVYAPPGSASSVTYGNSESAGNSESISSNTTSSYTESVSFGFQWNTLWSGGSISDTLSNGWSTQNGQGNTMSITSTQGNSVATAGPVSSALGVNHDNDVIYILLNPVVDTTATGPGTSGTTFNWTGLQYNSCDLTDSQFIPNVYQGASGCDPNQYPFPDIVGIPVWCLKNPYYPGQSCAQWLPYTSRAWDAVVWGNGNKTGLPLGPLLTLQDYADILSADPFVTQTLLPPTQAANYYCHSGYGVNVDPNDAETIPAVPTTAPPSGSWPTNYCGTPNNGSTTNVTMQRFDAYGQVQYPQPGINGEPQTYSGTLSYNQTTGFSQSATSTSSAGNNFQISGWGGFLGNGLSFGYDSGQSWSWSSTTASAQTSGTTNTASYSITGPQGSDNYQGPVTFNVYQDSVFGTFAFYSDLQREQPPIQLSGALGATVAANGLAMSGTSFESPILVNLVNSNGTTGAQLVAGTPFSFTGTVTVCNPSPSCPAPDVQEILLTNNSPNNMTMAAPAVTFSDPGFQPIENNPNTYPDGCSNQYLAAAATCKLYIEFAPVLADAPNPLVNPNPVTASMIAAGTENITSYQNILVTSTGLIVTGNAAPVATAGVTVRPATTGTVKGMPNLYAFPQSTGAETEQFTVTNYNTSSVTLSAAKADITLTDGVDFTVQSDTCAGAALKAATAPSGTKAGVPGGTCTFTLQFLPEQAPPSTGSTAYLYTTIITANGTVSGAGGPTNLAYAGAEGFEPFSISMSPSVGCAWPNRGGGTSETCSSTTITNNSPSTFTLTSVTDTITSTTGTIEGDPTFGLGACSSIAAGKTCTATATAYFPTCSPAGASCGDSGTITVTGTLNGTSVSASIGATGTWSECNGDGCGAGVVRLTGTELSKQVTKPATYATAKVSIAGAVKTPFTGTRTISLTVGGFTATASYGSTATDATIAKALAAAANVEGSPVTAKVSGDTVTLTNKTAGTAGNISYTATDSSDFTISPGAGSLSGGANAITTTEYDAGTVNATVGSVTASAKWEKTSTSETLAKALAASLNSAGKGAFTATVSGSTVTITPASGMPAPSISVSVEDSMGFNPASFAASTGN